MVANTIRHKRNSTPSAAPSVGQLVAGELAINTYDGKVYLKKDNNTIIDIVSSQTSGVYAPLNSPSFTGIPIGPNPTISNSSNQLATTSFVQSIFASAQNTISRSIINVATTGYSSFNIPGGYTVGRLDLFQNGVKLLENLDFIASDGVSVNLVKTVPSGSSLEYLINYSTSSYASFSGVISPTGNFTSSLFVNSIPVSISGHTHSSSNITNFSSSVSGLLPVKNIVAGTNVSVSSSDGTYTISSTLDTISANNITLGTLPDERLSNNVTRNDNLRWAMQANTNSIDWLPRGHGTIGNASISSGQLVLAFFTAPYNMTATRLTFVTGGTATAALSLCRFALFTVDETITDSVTATTPVVTMVARTANDTTIGNTIQTIYTRTFSSAGGYPDSYNLVAGTRYAVGIIVVGTTTGTWQAGTVTTGAHMRLPPMAAGVIGGQSDIPTAATSVSTGSFMLYGRIS